MYPYRYIYCGDQEGPQIFRNAIEGFNALWQSKVWQRHHFPHVKVLAAGSVRYIAAQPVPT